jgi:hypothetical protein
MDLETIIEDEFFEYNLESDLTPEEVYGIEFDERYIFDHGFSELEDAVEKIQESGIGPDIIKPEITELTPDIGIVRIEPPNHPKILRHLDPKLRNSP